MRNRAYLAVFLVIGFLAPMCIASPAQHVDTGLLQNRVAPARKPPSPPSAAISVWCAFECAEPDTIRLSLWLGRAILTSSVPVAPPGHFRGRKAVVPASVYRTALRKLGSARFWHLSDERKPSDDERSQIAGDIVVACRDVGKHHSVRFYAHYDLKRTYRSRYDRLAGLMVYMARLERLYLPHKRIRRRPRGPERQQCY